MSVAVRPSVKNLAMCPLRVASGCVWPITGRRWVAVADLLASHRISQLLRDLTALRNQVNDLQRELAAARAERDQAIRERLLRESNG